MSDPMKETLGDVPHELVNALFRSYGYEDARHGYVIATGNSDAIEDAIREGMVRMADEIKKLYEWDHDACSEMAGGCSIVEEIEALKSHILVSIEKQGGDSK
jgi:hypothetical protein